MLKILLSHPLIIGGLLAPAAIPALAQQVTVQRLPTGVVLHLTPAHDLAVRTVRLQVVAPGIIHVQASPLDSVSSMPSLMAVAPSGPAVPWQLKQRKDAVTVSTAALQATVSLATGAVTFADGTPG